MNCTQACCGFDKEFDQKLAQKELRNYQKTGKPKKNTKALLDVILKENIKQCSLIDIGGGVGVIPIELIIKGISKATVIEISTAYLNAARQNADKQGVINHIEFHLGDFAHLKDRVSEADIVTLDKSICCYENYHDLVRFSTAKAKHFYGIIIPRDEWWVKFFHGVELFFRKIVGNKFRSYIHPVIEIEQTIKEAGLKRIHLKYQREWIIAVYQRSS